MTTTPSTRVSHVKIGESIAAEPILPDPFVPGDGNLFPKWPSRIDKDSWDEWQFQAMAADGSAAIVVIFFRHTGNAPAGFRVGFNASWAGKDSEKEAVWCGHVALPHSVITSDPVRGHVTGVWSSDADNEPPRICFDVAADLSRAVVTFDVPGKVIGTIALASAGFDALPQTEAEAKFMPTFWWLRPIAMAAATADLTFYPQDNKTTGGKAETDFPKVLRLREEDGAFGSMERAWSTLPMAKCLTHNWWLWARAGPYALQLVWLRGRPEEKGVLWGSGRLYRDGELVCAPQRAVAANHVSDGGNDDTLTVEYLYGEDGHGITGAFRLKNVGHRAVFRSGGQTWDFASRHVRPWYNLPTSPPGPNASGLSGFVLSVTGGLAGSADISQGPGVVGGGTVP